MIVSPPFVILLGWKEIMKSPCLLTFVWRSAGIRAPVREIAFVLERIAQTSSSTMSASLVNLEPTSKARIYCSKNSHSSNDLE